MSFRFTEDDLFADLTMTEFLVATIATELTVRETVEPPDLRRHHGRRCGC